MTTLYALGILATLAGLAALLRVLRRRWERQRYERWLASLSPFDRALYDLRLGFESMMVAIGEALLPPMQQFVAWFDDHQDDLLRAVRMAQSALDDA